MEASAKATLTANGSLEIVSATADIGPGTYTMMTQIAAEMLGVPIEHVTAKLGDSGLPDAPVEGGSFTTSSVGCAIQTACRAVQKELLRLAQKAPRRKKTANTRITLIRQFLPRSKSMSRSALSG